MNFDDAIKAHTFWKVTLRWLINGQKPASGLKPGSSTDCELGQWILGAGSLFQQLPAYQALIHEHAEFHRIADRVVTTFESGKIDEARAMLAPEGSFSVSSAKTIDAIKALQTSVAKLADPGNPDH